ncbi:MAG: hypothetical protein EOP49_12725 [Sphingobacteriales bacterium]|nr:MAG: hypothetical protein EOP49_12725 [Sphingobacteriales bacterium]
MRVQYSVASRPRMRNLLTEAMLQAMIDHYCNEHAGDSIAISVGRSDTLLKMSFTGTAGDVDA